MNYSKIALLLANLTVLTGCEAKSVREGISIAFRDNVVKIKNTLSDSVSVTAQGADVLIDSKKKAGNVVIRLSGKSDDGHLTLKKKGAVTLVLDGITLNSQEGAPLLIKNKKPVEIVATKGTSNALSISACQDTAQHKGAVIWSKGDIQFSGEGKLDLLAAGDGCRGINAKGNVDIQELTLNIVTLGNNLGKDTRMPNFGGGMPPMGPPPGNFPPMGGPGGMPDFGNFPPMGGPGEMPGFGGPGASGDPDDTIKVEGFKQKYLKTTKAIRSEGNITIHSGNLYCKTLSAGAEGMEGKLGVSIEGGLVKVDAVDDAINSNGPIYFLGGITIAESHCNDAVDSNYGGLFGGPGMKQPSDNKQASIAIRGGEVYPWSHVGAPEEGLDCDFAAIEVSGGQLFSIGSGMGNSPSVPTQESAKQPTLLLTGTNLVKGEKLEIYEGNRCIFSLDIPFSFNGTQSLISCPALQKGKTYRIHTGEYDKSVTLSENFVVI